MITVFSLILILALTVFVQKKTKVELSNQSNIKGDIKLAPCENEDRLEAVKKLFREKGAEESDLVVEKFENVENLVITLNGKSDETIIIGAHYDKTSLGCGVIDNWTGIVILANLFRTMKDFKTAKTYKIIAFGKEEKGLIGSRAMAKSIPEENRGNYCAMLNLDSFGFTYPQALGNSSDNSLIKVARETSEDFKIPFSDNSITGADTDSTSFREIKVPAISIHGLSSNWREYLHKDSDRTVNVNSESVYIGYRFALQFLAKIDGAGCGDFR